MYPTNALGGMLLVFFLEKNNESDVDGRGEDTKGKEMKLERDGNFVKTWRSSSVHEEIIKVIRGHFLFMSIDLVINY